MNLDWKLQSVQTDVEKMQLWLIGLSLNDFGHHGHKSFFLIFFYVYSVDIFFISSFQQGVRKVKIEVEAFHVKPKKELKKKF